MLFQWIPIYPVQIVENINDLLRFLVVGDGCTKSDIQVWSCCHQNIYRAVASSATLLKTRPGQQNTLARTLSAMLSKDLTSFCQIFFTGFINLLILSHIFQISTLLPVFLYQEIDIIDNIVFALCRGEDVTKHHPPFEGEGRCYCPPDFHSTRVT